MKSITKSGSVSKKTCWSDERPGSSASWMGFLVKLGAQRNWNFEESQNMFSSQVR